jgi:hypothetical protein
MGGKEDEEMDSQSGSSDDDDSDYEEVEVGREDMERLLALESELNKAGAVYDKHVEV